MKCHMTFVGVALAAVGSLIADSAAAQAPDSIQHYRFLPRFSVLNQSGGIAGFDIDFRVLGTFDFVTRPGETDAWPSRTSAKFANVDAWASHPVLAYVLPLDQTINLSGLKGRQLPVLASFDVYKFEGQTQDGSAVNLLASAIGPWLHLRGKTTPPPGSADFFEYTIRAVARTRPYADFDDNDVVDRRDLSRWMTRFGLNAAAGHVSLGDANGDELVDGTDFLAWQRQLGEMAPPVESFDAMVDAALATIAAAEAPNVSAVPEPTAWVIAVTAGMTITAARRRLRGPRAPA
jgi:hypothetical protein